MPPIPKLKPGKLSIGLIILFLTFFMLFSSPWFYGQYAPEVQTIYVWYILLAVGVVAFTQMQFPTMKQSPKELSWFLLLFVATLPVALMAKYAFNVQGSIEVLSMVLAFGFLHAFVKAYIEEGVFRGILMKFSGIYGQALIFGLFHFGVLSMTAGVLVTAGFLEAAAVPVFIFVNTAILTLLGIVWGFVYLRYGLMASTGSHFAWNAVMYGAITLPVLVGGAI